MQSAAKVKGFQGLTPFKEIDLRSLADAGDERDTFLSIYLTTNIRDDRPFVASRLKAIEKALPRGLKDAFLGTRELIEPIMAELPLKGEKGRIIFASALQGFLEAYRVSIELEPLVVWDRSPFLLPIARLKGDYEDYGLLLLDSQEARLFLISSGAMEEIDKSRIDLMNKHKKGGWSQMRYNRLRKGAIKSFFSQLIDDLQSHDDLLSVRGMIVAGPGEAKDQFVEMLPSALKAKVLGSMDLQIETPAGDLLKLGEEISRSSIKADSTAMAERLKEAVLRGEPAAYGLTEVRKALEDGRVNFLLISAGFALPQMICMSCHHVHKEGEICPTCGGEMAALRLEEFYEMAERTGAEAVLVEDDGFLESIGHVGAILRY
jgi:peptide chain release factor subunit 1